MKLSSRILALMLAVMLSLTAFIGCDSEGTEETSAVTTTLGQTDVPTDAPTDVPTDVPTDAPTDVPTDVPTDAPTDVPTDTPDVPNDGPVSDTDPGTEETPDIPEIPESNTIEIDASNIAEYSIVVPAEPSNLLSAAVADFYADTAEIFGANFVLSNDSAAESEKEIIIGRTSRDVSQALSADVRKEESGIVVKGEKIYIFGFNDLYVEEALEYFKETFIDSEAKKLSVDKDLERYISPYLLKKVTIDGVDIKNYKIIISEDADLLTQYAAENLSNYFDTNGIGSLTVAKDNVKETQYEILIGDTNRAASNISVTTADGEYILYKSGDKIVCQGENIWVGGGAGAIIGRLPTEGSNAVVDITDISTEPVAQKFEFKKANSAIIMIGDGMGFNTVDMFKADKNAVFYAEYMTNKGNAYTGSYTTAQNSSTPTDSAAAGTALSSGYKTVNGYLGVTPSKNAMPNVRELAHMMGAKTAVLSTDAITGATPSAFLIHHDNRNDTSIIQDRINELINNKGVDVCSGSITALKKITASSLKKVSQNGSDFFVMIEEGHIDKRSHSNDRVGCVDMVERFNQTIAYVIEFVICHPDTVLIITADHETGGITKNADGTFKYTVTTHSTQNVPVYALGYGTECFNDKEVDNTEIPKFVSKIFGAINFGVEK